MGVRVPVGGSLEGRISVGRSTRTPRRGICLEAVGSERIALLGPRGATDSSGLGRGQVRGGGHRVDVRVDVGA